MDDDNVPWIKEYKLVNSLHPKSGGKKKKQGQRNKEAHSLHIDRVLWEDDVYIHIKVVRRRGHIYTYN